MIPTYATTVQQIEYYPATLIKQYLQQPKAFETIEVLAILALMPQIGQIISNNEGVVITDNEGRMLTTGDFNADPILPLAVGQAFNVKTAVGQQLQFLAETIGVRNTGYNLSGFNLLGQYVTLSNTDFQLLIASGTGRNFLRATTSGIQNFIAQFFANILQVVDDEYMHMSVFYLVKLGSAEWVELFVTQGLLPKPIGVGISFVYFYPYLSTKLYGFVDTISPPKPYISQISTTIAPLTGHTLDSQDALKPF